METESITKTAYDSLVVAKYFLALAYSKGKILNATKLQKLLYMAYGYILANYGYTFILENPQAWPFGPVFPRVQKKVSLDSVIQLDDTIFTEINGDEIVKNTFKTIIDKYSEYTAGQLTSWSHKEGSPWYLTTKLDGFNWGGKIPTAYISDYFNRFQL